ncbi:iron transporter [Candidatus Collierbacteria bacterium RIFOXYD1_FULL_40_9]|uniref:Iron transporter n=1 Tax=Candidatus Collierbacteria bacterium RIFOXYD1_FULL_40_9 TaxID=1817731 RepID=A0A1F5FUX9_9BACT|nr:MAG: iron transporter [Candidatus Collierbacteria bacterium RIFOXYD1_FULL_40_9]
MKFLWKKLFKKIGPGFVTGAADDDPSGIATYSIAGAKFGLGMSWLSVFLLPAMIAIQEMCGRLGLITGRGLASIIAKYSSKKVMWFAVLLLGVANTINIGANLGIMASSLQMILGLPFFFWLFVVAMGIVILEIWIPYRIYSESLKWLGCLLLVYVITAFLVKPDWVEVINATLVPRISWSMDYVMTLVAFLGTTISPYLFFWQTSQEVEEEILEKRVVDFNSKPETTGAMIKKMRLDTGIGMFFSNLMTFFIILTTAYTLNKNGIFEINGAEDAALALKPLAGEMAYLLFTLGIVGIGLQAIPVLAGSIAYAFSEAFGIREGLGKSFNKAKGFYLIIALSTMVGVLMNMLGVNTIRALYYSAVVNGVVAVPLIFIIIRLADSEKVVGKFRSSNFQRVVAWLIFGFMLLAVLLMFFNWGSN